MVKYSRNKTVPTYADGSFWNGMSSLPDEINVMSYHESMAEFELLSMICTLHGCITAYDLLTGAVEGTEKDRDIQSVMTAFQAYLHPKMPSSKYSDSDKRLKIHSATKDRG